MKKGIFIFLTLLILFAFNQSQISQTQFQIALNAAVNGTAIFPTTDGGYIASGNILYSWGGHFDFYVIKLDAIGTMQWTKTIGGTEDDVANSVIQTADGGYAVAGTTLSYGVGNKDIYLVKLDSTGTLLWNRTVGGPGEDDGNSVIQTLDGGFAIAGNTWSFGPSREMYIVKLDGNGSLQWTKSIGGAPGSDYANSIIQTADGGYAIAGATFAFGAGGLDACIAKLSSDGTLQWYRSIGGTNDDVAYSIIQSSDGSYLIAGGTNSFGEGVGDMYIVKFDSVGSIQWSRTIGGPGGDGAYSLIQLTDGGYAISGYQNNSFSVWGTMYVVKLSSSGILLWSKKVAEINDYGHAFSVIKTADGGYVLAGMQGPIGLYIVKFDSNWNTCGNSSLVSSLIDSGGTIVAPNPAVSSPLPSFTSPTPTAGTSGYVSRICFVGIQPISNEIPVSFKLSQNYPNPFNPNSKIKFDIPPSRGARGVTASLIIYRYPRQRNCCFG